MKKKLFIFIFMILTFFLSVSTIFAEEKEEEKTVQITKALEGQSLFDYLYESGIDFTKVTKVFFVDTTKTVDKYEVYLDISEEKNKSIMAGVSGEVLYIQSNGKLLLNENSSSFFSAVNQGEIIREIAGLENIDTSKVTNMDYMFNNLYLDELDLSSFNTSNVTSVYSMFSSLNTKKLILTNFDTTKVKDMSFMFSNLYITDNLDLSSFNTTNVENMSHMFSFAYIEKELNLSSFDTSNVSNMSNMFCNIDIKSLDLSSFNTSKVITMERMFGQLPEIKELNISNFDTSNVVNMEYMFYSSKAITNLDLKNLNTSNVTSMFAMFGDMKSLSTLDLSGIDTSNVTNMTGMFSGLEKITSLNLSSFDTSKVTDMTMMFSGMKSITQLDLSNFNTARVTSMIQMFMNCSSLQEIVLSNFDTSRVTNMSHMFYGDYSLKELDLSSFVITKRTSTDYMLSNTYLLELITYDGAGKVSLSNSLFNVNDGVEYSEIESLPKGTKLAIAYEIVLNQDNCEENCNQYHTAYYKEKYGELPVLTRTGYAFLGWFNNKGELITKDTICLGDTSLTAKWEKTSYVVSWKNDDGKLLETDENVEPGTIPTYNGKTPTKEKDAQYTYTFAGWDKEISSVTEDVTYTATYEKTLNEYTVTWIDGDGKTCLTAQFKYGETPDYEFITGKSSTPEYHYIFIGWDKEYTPVTSDQTYTALFREEKNTYVITWKNADGTILEKDEKVEYGTTPSYDGEIPTKDNDGDYKYTFAGWDKELAEVTENITYTAVYTSSELKTHLASAVEGQSIFEYLQKQGMDLSNIKYLEFIDTAKTDERYDVYLDISENKDGSIKAGIDGEILYIQSEGRIELYPNSSYLFANNDKIEKIEGLENIDTSNVINMRRMFADDLNLKELDLSTFDTSNVTNMDSMFCYDTNLYKLNISNFDTSKVTEMEFMFSTTSKLKNIDVSNFETSNATDMSFMFIYSGVENLDVSNFNTSNVTNMAGMFGSMESISTLDLSNFDTSNVTNMYAMFGTWEDNNSKLKSIDLSSFDTSNVTDMGRMFACLKNLESLDLSNFDTTKVTNMINMFDHLLSLDVLDLSSFNIYSNPNLTLYNDNYEIITPNYIGPNIKIEIYGTYYDRDYNAYSKLDSETPIRSSLKTVTKYKLYSFDEEIGELLVRAKEKITLPILEKAGYEFLGWYKSNELITSDIVNDNAEYFGSNDYIILNAKWEINEYTVTWKNEDGSILKTDTVEYGTIPKYSGNTPTKKEDSKYTYTFDKWDKELTEVKENITYTAVFKASPKSDTPTEPEEPDQRKEPDFTKVKGNFNSKEQLIRDIPSGLSVSDLYTTIINNSSIVIYNTKGSEMYSSMNTKNPNEIIKTGYFLTYIDATNKTVKVILSVGGDVNGDGEITPLDYVRIKNHIMETSIIKDKAQIAAADYNNDGQISPLDYVKVKNYIMNGGN